MLKADNEQEEATQVQLLETIAKIEDEVIQSEPELTEARFEFSQVDKIDQVIRDEVEILH